MAHIVHVCPRYLPARGGVELFFAKISEHFVRQGHTVSVWTTDAVTVSDFTRRPRTRLLASRESVGGVTVQRFPIRYLPAQRLVRTAAHVLPFGPRWKSDTLRWTPFVPALTGRARKTSETVDLVHAAGLPYTSVLWAGAALAEQASAPLVISPFTHVPAPGTAGTLMRRAYLSDLNLEILSRAARVFVQTELERDVLTAAGLACERQVVVGLGVEPSECCGGDRHRFRAAHGIPDAEIVVGHLANKSWDKGTVDVLDAAERLWGAGASFILVLAGAEMRSFTERWNRVRFPERVRNLGPLSDEERNDFLAAIDVFALPSYVESFGISSLEAALNGAAVIAYGHGGPGQIFRSGLSALLPPPGDLEQLARALSTLVRDGDARRRLAAAAESVARDYSWSRIFTIVSAAYQSLLQDRSARRF
jgi:glycosyltransferase involved in cell wall biosynthesis